MIPRMLHFLWISDGSPLPEDVLANVLSWTDLHPDFESKVWGLDELRPLLVDFHGLGVLEAVEACRFPAMQSDVIRLALLYEYGGVWSDLKNRCLAPFLGELTDGPIFFVEHQPTTKLPDKPNYLTNSLMGSPSGESFLLDCLAEAVKLIGKRSTQWGVFGITGAGMLMRVMQRRMSDYHGWEHCILPREIWGTKVKRTSASYNANGQHWRERQDRESLYI